MNAPNLVLYNTHGVGDKCDKPFSKNLLFLCFIWKYRKYFYYFIYILLIIYFRREILLLSLCVINMYESYLFISPRKRLLVATNLLDLFLDLHSGRPIWATFVIRRQIVWGTNCKSCPFLRLFCIKWTNLVVFVLWAQTPKLSPYTLAWFWHWTLLFYLFCFRAKCVCVVLDFWMHLFIHECMGIIIFILFYEYKWRLFLSFVFRVCVCI
jgi:hypothetical protein